MMSKIADLKLDLVLEDLKSLEQSFFKQAAAYAQTRNVLKQIIDLRILLEAAAQSKDSIFQLNKVLNELGVTLSELDLEIEEDQVNKDQDIVKPEYLSKAFDLIEVLHKKTSDQLSSLEEIFNEFQNLSEEEQLELIQSDVPHSQFLKYQNKMSDKVRQVLFYKLATSPVIEVNDSFRKALEEEFFALKLAEHTRQDSVILELLSLKNHKVENVLAKRAAEIDVLAYWGLFSVENRKQLILQVNQLEEFKRIEPFLIHHATLDEATACWSEVLNKPWAEELLSYLLENEHKYLKLNTRYPNLFKKELILQP